MHPPSPNRCAPPPRNELRSAVRIKVLDVLSFVLLINRQFYEVCIHAGAGALGQQVRGRPPQAMRGDAHPRGSAWPFQGTTRLLGLAWDLGSASASLWQALFPRSSLPPSLPWCLLPGLWLSGQDGIVPALRKTVLHGDIFFLFL